MSDGLRHHLRRLGWALLAGAGAAAVGGLLWKLPQWQTAAAGATLAPADLLRVQNELRQTLALLCGAALGLAGFALLWRRIAAGEQAARQALQVALDGQRSERFTRALGQLADDRLEVRLGAIYGLEQVAAESTAQRGAIIEILCAFVRDRAGFDAERPPAPRLATDVQAALTVLGRRAPGAEPRLDLRRTDLRGAELNGLRLERANLFEAHLEDASLQGAHFEGADLRGAYLSRADLVEANLKGADLRQAHLEATYLVEAHLEGADLGGAFMAGAYLGGAHLEGADLGGAHLDGAYLYKAHLEGASLHGARVVSAIGIHRDERERINRTAAAETAPPPAPRQLRRPQPPAASPDEPVPLHRRRDRA